MSNNLYVLDGAVACGSTTAVNTMAGTRRLCATAQTARPSKKTKCSTTPPQPTDDLLWEWHRKLNHADFRLVAQVIAPLADPATDRLITDRTCPDCAQGQAKRVSYRNQRHYVPPLPLEALNGDLCGPVKPKTPHGEAYTSMLIDQASRLIFGRLLKKKHEAVHHLDELTTTLSNQVPDARIGRLVTDSGGEYTGSVFRASCEARGIRQLFTNAHAPEESHLAEKSNEYVFNKVRVLMTMTGLPTRLWGHCFNYVVHVYNNTPQELLGGRTPFEALFNKPSRLHMLKTFGCLAYKFIPKSERATKLTSPAIPCVFLGYAKDLLGYLLWDPKTRKVSTSRSVTFDEANIRTGCMFSTVDHTGGRLVIPARVGHEDDESLARRRFTTEEDDSSDDGHVATLTAPVVHSTRSRKPAALQANSVSTTATTKTRRIHEPNSWAEIMRSPYRAQWIAARDAEFQAMMDRGVWELVDLPPGRKALTPKWVHTVKYDANGDVDRFKARLVIKGFLQVAGQDFVDTFAPVLRLESLRVFAAIVAVLDLETLQLDIKTAFLYADLDEDI